MQSGLIIVSSTMDRTRRDTAAAAACLHTAAWGVHTEVLSKQTQQNNMTTVPTSWLK